MFKAKYTHLKTGEEYFMTVYGESEFEAHKQAKRIARKGYRLTLLIGSPCWNLS